MIYDLDRQKRASRMGNDKRSLWTRGGMLEDSTRMYLHWTPATRQFPNAAANLVSEVRLCGQGGLRRAVASASGLADNFSKARYTFFNTFSWWARG